MNKSNNFVNRSSLLHSTIREVDIDNNTYSKLNEIMDKQKLTFNEVLIKLLATNNKLSSFVEIPSSDVNVECEEVLPVVQVLDRMSIADKILFEIEEKASNFSRISGIKTGQFGKGIYLKHCSDPLELYEDRILVEVFSDENELCEAYPSDSCYTSFIINNNFESKVVVYFQCSCSMYSLFPETYMKQLSEKFEISVMYCETRGEKISFSDYEGAI